MTFKSKTMAILSAVAVSGILFTASASAALTSGQIKIQAFLPDNVVLENPQGTQVLATDAQFAQAVVDSINSKSVKKKLSAKAAVQAALGLAGSTSANYPYATTTIVTAVSSALAKNTTLLKQAIGGAYATFGFGATTDDNSAAAALIDSSLLGIAGSGNSASKTSAAYTTAVKAAVKAAVSVSASSGAAVGAAAQFTNNTGLLSSVIAAAISGNAKNYPEMTQAITTAVQAILGGNYTDDTSALIKAAVFSGYKKGLGKPVTGGKKDAALAAIDTAIANGKAASTGLGAAGLASYTYFNLTAGPVTDIYGL